jgi:spermidine synthase
MKRTFFVALGLAVTVVVGLAAYVAVQAAATEETKILYDRDSKYYRIQVVDYLKEGRRCLIFSKSRGIQSSMILVEPKKLDFLYCQSMIAAFGLQPEAKDVLLIGLGGASIPKFIQDQFPNVKLDVVEIDPDVVKVCQEWFQFKGTPNTRVIVMDGRMYLKQSEKKYDIILLDAYASDHVPFHMTTEEFLTLIKSRLNTGGVVASNLWEPGLNRFYFAEVRTYQKLFPQTYALRCDVTGNVIILGTPAEKAVTKEDWMKGSLKVQGTSKFGFDMGVLVAKGFVYLTPQKITEKSLTDDMAPVDTLRRENPKFFDKP